MTPVTVAYAAGLIEGEGCFSTHLITGHFYPRITVTMTDREPLDRLVETFPFLKVTGPHTRKPSAAGVARKDSYTVCTSRFEYVQAVIAAVWPWLSPRRQAAAETALLSAQR